MDRERWQQLSPLLDALLDLDPARRAARLAELRRTDALLADELAGLLASAPKADDAQFLSGNVAASLVAEPAATPTLAGERIGAYVLETPLGQGGTGVVWQARRADGRFEGAVAFKLLHLSLLGRAGALRFEREGAILARLAHPHIASLLDAGVTPAGQPYLVLELIEGEPIDRHCDAKRLNVAQRVTLFRGVLAAVAHAHRHLVVHRDIKPSNILVAGDGRVKLLDFGIAKLLQGEGIGADATQITREGGRALTPEYAAPEQLRGDDVTTATDVYSLGVLLFQLLAGRHPTAPEHGTLAEVMQATLATDPGRLSTTLTGSTQASRQAQEGIASDRATSLPALRRQLRGDLETIVDKALRKLPAERYSSVDVFSEDLRRWLDGEPVTARPATLAYRVGRFVTRHRGAVAAATLLFAAIVAGLIGTITEARRAEQQSERAQHEAAAALRQRDAALQQQVLLRGNNEFLQLLMRDAAGQDPGAIRRQLDRASQLIENTRFERPIVKVALLRQIGGRYAELGDVAAGARMLRRAIASIGGTDLAAPTSGIPINLACSLALYLQDADDLAGAAAELDHADRMLTPDVDLSVPSRVECQMIRSYVETAAGHLERGVTVARDALRSLEAAGIRDGEQHRIVRSAVARALLGAGRNAEALAIAGPLLEEGVAAQGRGSMAVIRRSNLVTRMTLQGGQPLAALALSQADEDSVAQLLGSDRTNATIDLAHGQVLLALNRNAEAAAILLRSAAAARAGGELQIVLPAELGACEALLRQGRTHEARQLFMQGSAAGQAAVRGGWTLGVQVLRVEALLAGAEGDHAAASRSLAAARVLADAISAPAHIRDFGIERTRAELALADATNDPGAARTALAAADGAVAAARRVALQADRSSAVGYALLLRARSLVALRQPAAARSAAEAARSELESTLGADNSDTRAASALAQGS